MSANVKNGSEAKFYPTTHVTIERALMTAKAMNDNLGSSTLLSQKTSDRLNAIQPLFRQGTALVGQRKGERALLNSQKNKARTDTVLFTSHFLQVFNMGAKRGKYNAVDRVLFGMSADSDALPSLKGDSQIQNAAEYVISGEAKRIAAGKEAVSNPSAAEVEEKYNLFMQLEHLSANANFALIDEQQALRALAKEGRAVIKKVWREIEVHYCEGTREHMRKMAREWGVQYARKGGEKRVRGTITDADTGLPLPAVKVKFANGNNKVLTGMDGRFTLITNLMHSQNLLASRTGYDNTEIIIELKEGEENSCAFRMERAL